MMLRGEEDARNWIAALPGLHEDAIARLDAFRLLLIDEAGRQNLIASSTIEHIWLRHFADSLQLLPMVDALAVDRSSKNAPWIDLGTGAGFPGLVIALVDPRPMLLVESRAKRTAWLQHVVDYFTLDHVSIHAGPLEKLATQEASVISARAFAQLVPLLDKSARFSTTETIWALPKGRGADKELASIAARWQNMFHVKQSCTDKDAGVIVGRLGARLAPRPALSRSANSPRKRMS